MSPEISIIVPVYKGIRFLREALDSVKVQSFSDWECVCVDDGSKDGSGALLDEIAADEPRIRVFHRENGGTSVARNFALGEARGRYVAFLDEDDVYHPRLLEVLHGAAEATGADVIGCTNLEFAETAHPEFPAEVPGKEIWKVGGRREIAEWMTHLYREIPFSIWLNLYRRELVEGHAFWPNVRIEQDMLWHYTLLPRVGKYVRIPWNGYAWRASSIGGFLHPDAESLISWPCSWRTVIDEAVPQMGLEQAQRGRFLCEVGELLYHCVWEPVHRGLTFDHEQAERLRRALLELKHRGVDVGRTMSLRKRLLWTVFLLTGNLSVLRSRRVGVKGTT